MVLRVLAAQQSSWADGPNGVVLIGCLEKQIHLHGDVWEKQPTAAGPTQSLPDPAALLPRGTPHLQACVVPLSYF